MFRIHTRIPASDGKDALGQFLIQHVKEREIDAGCISQVDYATSMVMIPKSVGTPILIFYRDADYHLAYDDILDRVPEGFKDPSLFLLACFEESGESYARTSHRDDAQAGRADMLRSQLPSRDMRRRGGRSLFCEPAKAGN